MTSILFPLEGFNASGGLRVITLLANHLSIQGYNVTVLVPDYASRPYYLFDQRVLVKIIKTPNFFPKKIYYFLYMVMVSGSRKFSISIATGFKTPLYIHLSKWVNLSNIKVLYLIQHYEISSQIEFGNSNISISKGIKKWIANFGYKQRSCKVAVSEWIKERIGDSSIIVIPNGIDTRYFDVNVKPENRNLKSIGIVGSIKPIKGYDYMLDAIRQLPPEILSSITLNIMTTDSELKLPHFVNYKLYHPVIDEDIVRFYNSCFVFVFGSFEEGFGLPPLEAMACGCVVVSSDCGGVRQFLNKNNSFLFEPGNVTQLSNLLRKLINEPEIPLNYCNRSIESAKEYSLDKMLTHYTSLIAEISKC